LSEKYFVRVGRKGRRMVKTIRLSSRSKKGGEGGKVSEDRDKLG